MRPTISSRQHFRCPCPVESNLPIVILTPTAQCASSAFVSSPIVLCRRTQSDSGCTQQKHRHHIVPPPSMSSATCTSQSQCQFLKRWLFRTFRDETEKRRKANTLFVTVDAPASDAYYPSCAPPHHSTMSCLHSTLSAAFHVPCATLRFLTLFTFIKALRLGLFIYFYISDGAITVHLIELSISPPVTRSVTKCVRFAPPERTPSPSICGIGTSLSIHNPP
jgi:hypothetical protein